MNHTPQLWTRQKIVESIIDCTLHARAKKTGLMYPPELRAQILERMKGIAGAQAMVDAISRPIKVFESVP